MPAPVTQCATTSVSSSPPSRERTAIASRHVPCNGSSRLLGHTGNRAHHHDVARIDGASQVALPSPGPGGSGRLRARAVFVAPPRMIRRGRISELSEEHKQAVTIAFVQLERGAQHVIAQHLLIARRAAHVTIDEIQASLPGMPRHPSDRPQQRVHDTSRTIEPDDEHDRHETITGPADKSFTRDRMMATRPSTPHTLTSYTPSSTTPTPTDRPERPERRARFEALGSHRSAPERHALAACCHHRTLRPCTTPPTSTLEDRSFSPSREHTFVPSSSQALPSSHSPASNKTDHHPPTMSETLGHGR
jgi:hypothetical protein